MNITAATWNTISIVAFSLAGVSFALTVFLFLRYDVIALIGEISGKTAEKQVKQIRETNRAYTGKLQTVSSDKKAEKLTKDVARNIYDSKSDGKSRRIGISRQLNGQQSFAMPQTTAVNAPQSAPMPQQPAMEFSEATTMLSPDASMEYSDATTLLDADAAMNVAGDATTVLQPGQLQNQAAPVQLLNEVTVIHSGEVIDI